jgi:hypothetical protein
MNIETLPPRIAVPVVCWLAGYGPTTLRARIKAGEMPQPIDRAKKLLFRTSDVLQALGLDAKVEPINPWDKACDFNETETA